jgi:hypothetical protein
VDIRIPLPDGTDIRERRKAPVTSKSAAQKWGEARERVLLVRSPKAVNNIVTVLSVALKTAVSWGVIERVPCTSRC